MSYRIVVPGQIGQTEDKVPLYVHCGPEGIYSLMGDAREATVWDHESDACAALLRAPSSVYFEGVVETVGEVPRIDTRIAQDKMPEWGVHGEETQRCAPGTPLTLAMVRDVVRKLKNAHNPDALIPLPAGYDRGSGYERIDGRADPGIPVTPEMLDAGIKAWDDAEEASGDWDDHMSAIYRAMCAVAPVELVSEGERSGAWLGDIWKCEHDIVVQQRDDGLRERDHLKAQLAMTERRLDMVCKGEAKAITERDAARDLRYDVVSRLQYVELQGEVVELKDKLRLALSTLASFTAADRPSEPEHNPFCVVERDRRRIGS